MAHQFFVGYKAAFEKSSFGRKTGQGKRRPLRNFLYIVFRQDDFMRYHATPSASP